MTLSVWITTLWMAICLSLVGEGTEKSRSGNDHARQPDQQGQYINPVFEPVLADPTVVRTDSFFYAYGTEDNWGDEGGYHLIPVIRSHDLVHWEFVNDGLPRKPDWKARGGIWAPDVSRVGDQFFMYYSFSAWGDPNPGIGLAVADRPEGPFRDQGKVFLSEEIGVANSIDPFFLSEDGRKYLFWGSFHGLFAVPLSEDGKRVSGEKIRVAGDHLEAVYVHRRAGYYYLFGSQGTCCEGAESTYRVKVGRSTALLGPYVDRAGNPLTAGPFGELLLKGNTGEKGFAGPGHNAEIVTDDAGHDWLLYHAMRKDNARLEHGTNRRSLMLDRIYWEDGWPRIRNGEPSMEITAAPVFSGK